MLCTKFQIFLIVIFVVSGTFNTLATKWQDGLKAVNSVGKLHKFHHPFIQVCFMFFGMFNCLLVFYITYYYHKRKSDGYEDENKLTKGNRKFNKFIFVLPAMCDFIGTGLSYLGLNMTYASSYQMLRGSVIIFVGVMSMIFLKRKINLRQWIGMITVIAGLVVVGVADFLLDDSSDSESDSKKSDEDSSSSLSTRDVVIGDILIVGSQLFTATQIVIEEKFAAGKDIPALQAIGLSGTFGLIVSSILLIPMYFIYVGKPFSDNPNGTLEDAVDAAYQYCNNGLIILASCFAFITTAFYNFAGISISKEISANTRKVLDSIRTIFIWVFSLLLFNQKFSWIQLIGFIILIVGLSIYNNLKFWMIPCMVRDYRKKKQQMEEEEKGEQKKKIDEEAGRKKG